MKSVRLVVTAVTARLRASLTTPLTSARSAIVLSAAAGLVLATGGSMAVLSAMPAAGQAVTLNAAAVNAAPLYPAGWKHPVTRFTAQLPLSWKHPVTRVTLQHAAGYTQAQLASFHAFHLAHLAHLTHEAHMAAIALAARQPAITSQAPPVSHYQCGDGDGDGYDIPCSQLHKAPAPAAVAAAPAPAQAAPATAQPSGGYSVGSSFQACVIRAESGGNAQIWNASGHYGLYQFSASTWALHGGDPSLFGHASAAYQTQVFWSTYNADGTSDWAQYDGC